jgi:hypothetical protein
MNLLIILAEAKRLKFRNYMKAIIDFGEAE